MSMKPPPPIPHDAGLVTPTASAVAVAASIALPPCFRIARPASDASALSDTTIALCACSARAGTTMTGVIAKKIVAAMMLANEVRGRRAIVRGSQSLFCVVTILAPPTYLTVRAIVGKHYQSLRLEFPLGIGGG